MPLAERQEYLDVVKGRAKALQSLITSFYDLSRLEGGEYPIQQERVDTPACPAFWPPFTATLPTGALT